MLARLQQILALGWAAALLLGAAWWTVLFGAWAGLAWTLGLLAWHAAWLALCMGLAHWRNRADAAPPATWRQWLRAWSQEAWLTPGIFFWRQPFRSHQYPDHLPPEAAGRRGVLLVHGFICNRGLWNPWLRRLRALGVPHAAISLEPVFGAIDDYAEAIDEAVRRLQAATGRPPLLVAHSMGGLALRAWLRRYDGDARMAGAITVGTPHQGTWLGHFAFSENGRQMACGSDWLQALAQAETPARRQAFTCFWGHADQIVFPASTACLADAECLHLPATAHLALLDHPQVWQRVLERLG